MLLDASTGVVHDDQSVPWFARILRDSYALRIDKPLGFDVEEFGRLQQPVLLNCLDSCYGHSLLKLLNAQYYLDNHPDTELVVLVPRFLRWMVPKGVASIWTVEVPLRQASQWNDWIAAEVRRRVEPIGQCWLSIAPGLPHPQDFSIERFTGVRPFPIAEWVDRLVRPTVTFIWREDRAWDKPPVAGRTDGLLRRARRRLLLNVRDQARRVVRVATAIREAFPEVDFAVAGLGERIRLPPWIADLRVKDVNEQVERSWCERYSRSHVVVGVHGSNMLLPSAHAGSVVELVPPDRWGSLIQDILLIPEESRQTMCRYRFIPVNSSAATAAEVVVALLRHLPSALVNFSKASCDHTVLQSDPWLSARLHQEIVEQRRRP